MEEKVKEIISKMEMLEGVIGQLYKTYAKIFPANYFFWTELSQEEEQHAKLVNDLKKELENNNIFFDKQRFNFNAIQTTIQYIQRKIRQANDGLINEQEAYNVAWDIENGLLEKNFFRTFTSNQNEAKRILDKLLHDTEDHRNRINKKKNSN
jgi:rubrerythrin